MDYKQYREMGSLSRLEKDVFATIGIVEKLLGREFNDAELEFYERKLKRCNNKIRNAVLKATHEPPQEMMIHALLLTKVDVEATIKAEAQDASREQKKEPKKKLLTTINSINPIKSIESIESIEQKNKTCEEKTALFIEEVKELGKEFPSIDENTFRQFCSYWTEPNQTKRKVRWEMQPTWDTKRRLSNWLARSNSFAKPGGGSQVLK